MLMTVKDGDFSFMKSWVAWRLKTFEAMYAAKGFGYGPEGLGTTEFSYASISREKTSD